MWKTIGQILGYIVVVIFILSYQAKEKKQLLFLQTLSTGLMCVHYALLGAWSGLTLNLVCLVRNYAYANTHKKPFSYTWFPYFLAAAIVGVGICSWEGWYSIFLIVALAVNTVFLSAQKANTVRVSVLFTCPMILTYDVFAGSIGGAINEAVSTISAIIGLIRHREKKEEVLKNTYVV